MAIRVAEALGDVVQRVELPLRLGIVDVHYALHLLVPLGADDRHQILGCRIERRERQTADEDVLEQREVGRDHREGVPPALLASAAGDQIDQGLTVGDAPNSGVCPFSSLAKVFIAVAQRIVLVGDGDVACLDLAVQLRLKHALVDHALCSRQLVDHALAQLLSRVSVTGASIHVQPKTPPGAREHAGHTIDVEAVAPVQLDLMAKLHGTEDHHNLAGKDGRRELRRRYLEPVYALAQLRVVVARGEAAQHLAQVSDGGLITGTAPGVRR